MGFPLLPFILLFLVLLSIRLHKLNAKREQEEAEFWEKERQANITPAKDISNLRYITIPIEKFPLNFSDDEEVIQIENELKELSTHKLLNLTRVTNTDLKLTYGVPNFETMSKIGDDYDRVTVLLNKYAEALMEAGRTDDVITVLEFAVGTGTDISESYTMLANCYKQKSLDTKLDILKNQVEQSSLYFKDSILEKIS
ncbi:hypothetical protein [Pseudobutyrivibrio xylanivorans]|uniref:Uncharacterized protein n=1 Tax=Pseudobutyrivibrio xylanivorans DSM 14809 TaxID=1123012 RepID=A0A1M6KE32_PSEXY|nr:hypothetical protein [Pseudobutyrivibrio xylanivorans]SHJ57190.1 hypothetical protein SAMN02745725_02843 [Pseudobutyrivibrio xylanivorans DSM 14809]